MEEEVYRQLYEREDAHWWFRGRRAVIWALLRRAGLPVRPRILDAGCGTGRNLVEFGSLGPARGVDPSAEAIAFCRRRGLEGVIQAGLEQLPFEDASFDVILATDVIEHIEHDDRALAELRRVAAADALLVLTVPAYQWLWSHHDETHHHRRRYTAPRLSAVAQATGWSPVVLTYFNTVLLPPIALVRGLGRLSLPERSGSDYDLTPGLLQRPLAQPMRAEAALIARGRRLPAGVSVGMVCVPHPAPSPPIPPVPASAPAEPRSEPISSSSSGRSRRSTLTP